MIKDDKIGDPTILGPSYQMTIWIIQIFGIKQANVQAKNVIFPLK